MDSDKRRSREDLGEKYRMNVLCGKKSSFNKGKKIKYFEKINNQTLSINSILYRAGEIDPDDW